MDIKIREDIINKLNNISRLSKEVKELSKMPSIESFMKFCDMYCKCAKWCLGELDRFPFEMEE
jgi:hypothetical protein